MNDIIKKHDNIFTFIIIILVISAYAFYFSVGGVDELCNIGNTYKIYNYGKIYNDCNVVSTPLFFYVGVLFFKIFGANYLIFRIYNLIIFIFLFFVTYLLLKELKLGKKYSFFVVVVTMTIINLFPVYSIFQSAGYNFFALVLFVLGILVEFKCSDKKINNILQGVFMFTIFYAKQNIGILYMLAYIITSIREKKSIKALIIKFLIAGILLIASLLHMFYNENLANFISYAFLGLSEFGRNNATYKVLPTVFITVIVALYMRKMIKENNIINSEEAKKIDYLMTFALILEFSHYPIIDIHHYLISGYLLIIIILYFLAKTLEVKKEENRKINQIVTIAIILITCCNIVIGAYYNIKYIKLFDKEDSIYYGAVYENGLKEKINSLCDYIVKKREQGISVKVVSYKAMLYMTRLKINNGDLDEPFLGNLGKEGKDGLIKKISQLKNSEILITKNEKSRCYQEPLEVRKFIMENYEQIGEIEEFYIYKTE